MTTDIAATFRDLSERLEELPLDKREAVKTALFLEIGKIMPRPPSTEQSNGVDVQRVLGDPEVQDGLKDLDRAKKENPGYEPVTSFTDPERAKGIFPQAALKEGQTDLDKQLAAAPLQEEADQICELALAGKFDEMTDFQKTFLTEGLSKTSVQQLMEEATVHIKFGDT